MILKRFVCVLVACLCLFSTKTEAYLTSLSPENFNALYNMASRGQVSAMINAVNRGLNIDATNPNGDTGLCIAAKKRNRTAYKSFLQSGANPSHPCTWKIEGYQDFARSVIENPVKNVDTATVAKYSKPGMSFTTKALIGAGVVAAIAGTAIALSGGGGGGGGSDKKTDPNCVHGTMKDGVCVCSTGYAGEKCDSCASGYGNYGTKQCYQTLQCEHGRQKGGSCACNVGYAGTLCDGCANGYGKDNTGLCVKKQHNNVIGNAVINSNYNETNNLSVFNSDYTDVYGLFYDANQTPHNHILSSDNFANGFFVIDTTDATTTVPDYVYDQANHIIWYDSNQQPQGYIIDGNAYDMTDIVVGHMIEDIVYGSSQQEIGRALKLGTQTVNGKYLVLNHSSDISVENYSDGMVYGMYSDNAQNTYNLKVTLTETGLLVSDIQTHERGYASSVINITNRGDGDVYGILGGNNVYSGDFEGIPDDKSPIALLTATINITNQGNGNAYGISSSNTDGTVYHLSKSENNMFLDSNTTVQNIGGSGNTYGLYSLGNIENSGQIRSIADAGDAYGFYTQKGKITNVKDMNESSLIYSATVKSTTGNAYGAYVEDGEIQNGRVIYAATTSGSGNAYGIYLKQNKDQTATVNNTSGLFVESAGGNAYGIYNKGGQVTNSTQRYEINVTSNSGYAYGIYSDGGSVTNSGRIYVTGPSKDKTYGIFATNNATVTNTGNFQFRINNSELNWQDSVIDCTSSGCLTPSGEHAIYLEKGAKFVNAGTVASTSSLNLGSRGVQVTTGGNFTASSIEGSLDVSSDVVSDGFNSSYTLSNAINAGNTENLSLSSESVLFNADLQGNDIVLTKKDFAQVVQNASLANFLEENYALANNESLFGSLKQKTSTTELNQTLNTLTGNDIISRFAFEDTLAQKELDFNISNNMFNTKGDSFSFAGSFSPQIDSKQRSNTRYALSGSQIGNLNFGVGLAISDIRTDNGRSKDRRLTKSFQLFAPFKMKNRGFEILFSPKLAYTYGSYDRKGFQNKNYDGQIEKRMIGVSNELRYPVKVAGFELSPAAEWNMSAYQTKLNEDVSPYSLSAKNQTTYSTELGFGAYLSKEKQFSKTSRLNFMAGAMLYHEFADPYKLKLSMNEMSGTFKLQDENRRKDYVVLRSRLSYDMNNVSIYGGFLSYIDGKYHTKADLGFKYAF